MPPRPPPHYCASRRSCRSVFRSHFALLAPYLWPCALTGALLANRSAFAPPALPRRVSSGQGGISLNESVYKTTGLTKSLRKTFTLPSSFGAVDSVASYSRARFKATRKRTNRGSIARLNHPLCPKCGDLSGGWSVCQHRAPNYLQFSHCVNRDRDLETLIAMLLI